MTSERDAIIVAALCMFTLQRALEWEEWDPEKVQRVSVMIIIILFLTGGGVASFSHSRSHSGSISRNITLLLSFACEELFESADTLGAFYILLSVQANLRRYVRTLGSCASCSVRGRAVFVIVLRFT